MADAQTVSQEPLSFKACRAITPVFKQGRQVGLALRAWHPSGRTLTDLCARGEVITADVIEKLLHAKQLAHSPQHLKDLVVTLNIYRVTVPAADAGLVADTLVRGGVRLLGLEEEELGLEEVFLRVTRGETQ